MDEKQRARIVLAEQLLEMAEHSSEAEMRSSLSRIYYAVYHLVKAYVGSMAHGEMPAALEEREKGLGDRFRRLLELRQGADYDPDFVNRRFGSLENFKLQFSAEMESARDLYEDILQLGKA